MELYLKKRDNRNSMATNHTSIQDFDNFDVNYVHGKFNYHPVKLSTFDDILCEMHKIELCSQSPEQWILFRHHRMKILLTLYILHINENLSLNNSSIGYVVILDPSLDSILGKKKSLVRYFAQEFGLFSKGSDAKKKIAIYKKRRAYVWKLQEDPIYSGIPVLQYFVQIQITKKYCEATLNRVYLKNEKISSVELDSNKLIEYNFFDQVVENLWCHLEPRNEGTLADFERFKIQMKIHLNQLVSLILAYSIDYLICVYK